MSDPCCCDEPRFPCSIPWQDDNPFKPGEAADPRVVGLAIVYSLLAGTIAHEERNDNEISEKVRRIADLFRRAVRLFDEKLGEKDELDKACVAVQELLSEWCCSLLYPGPCCEHDPHGVVIGCAVVCGGEIESIDPWGGRRWVMHYPLQAYWGAQFGVVPPDILASRVFGLICCLAGLERPVCEGLCSTRETWDEREFAVGSLRLGVGTGRSRMTDSDTAPHVRASRRQTVPLFEFAQRVLSAMAQPETQIDGPMVEIQLEGAPEYYLLVPDHGAPRTEMREQAEDEAAHIEHRAASAEAAPTGRDPIRVLVTEAHAVPRNRRALRPVPLLRGFAERLSIGLTYSHPITALAPPPLRGIPEALRDVGVETVGALLERTPEALAADVHGTITPRALSDVIHRGEMRVEAIVTATVEALQAAVGARGPVSTADLAGSDEARRRLVEFLEERLHLARETIEERLAEALA